MVYNEGSVAGPPSFTALADCTVFSTRLHTPLVVHYEWQKLVPTQPVGSHRKTSLPIYYGQFLIENKASLADTAETVFYSAVEGRIFLPFVSHSYGWSSVGVTQIEIQSQTFSGDALNKVYQAVFQQSAKE